MNKYVIGIVYLIGSLLLFGQTIFLLKKKTIKERKYLSYLLMSTSVWNLFSGLHIIASNYKLKILFHEMKYFGICTVSAFTLMFILAFLNMDKLLTKRNKLALMIIPFIMLILIFTNDYHHFFRKAIWVKEFIGYEVVLTDNNWAFWIITFYLYAQTFIGFVLLLSKWLYMPRVYRKQLNIILLGMITPMIVNFVYLAFNLNSKTLDPTPIAFFITALCVFYGMVSCDFMNVIPIAREYILKTINTPIIVIDTNNRIIDMNDAAEKTFQCSFSNYSAKHIEVLNVAFKARQIITSDETEKLELNSKIFSINRTEILNHDLKPIGKAIVFNDITEQEIYLNQLQYLSFHDALTGTYNRAYLNKLRDKIDTEENLPLGLIMGDLNGLKKLNDTLGHEMGDEAIKLTSKILNKNVVSGYVIRLGGDEFCIIIPNTTELQLKSIIKNIHLDFENIDKYSIGISLGYALKTKISQELNGLLREADNNLYAEKKYKQGL